MDYNNKYKERAPLDTVKVIKDFFNSINLFPREAVVKQAESSTWSCVIELYDQNDNFYFSQNGKGVTREYSLASGYAELYERFCNNIYEITNLFYLDKLFEINFAKNNFLLNKDEKHLSKPEFISSPLIKNYFESMFGPYLDLYLENLNPHLLIGVPYYNFITNEKIYQSQLGIKFIQGSTGMSAGNTLTEALNQGISELFEQDAYIKFYFSDEDFHLIENKNIKNEKLQEIIQNIEKLNNKVLIFDFSYIANSPTICTIIINYTLNNITFNIATFPILDIAIERTLTEIYQGRYCLNRELTYTQIPFKTLTFHDITIIGSTGLAHCPTIPEDIFKRIVIEEEFNKEYFFLNNNGDNEIILNYYKDLCKKQNINIFYKDNSKCADMAAVQIYSEDLTNMRIASLDYWNELNNGIKNNIVQILFTNFKIILEILNNSTQNFTQNYYQFFENLIYILGTYNFGPYEQGDYYQLNKANAIVYTPELIMAIMDCYEKLDDIDLNTTNTMYDKDFRKFIFIQKYKDSGYDNKEIFNFASVLGVHIDYDDLMYYKDVDYLLDKIVFNNIRRIYNEDMIESINRTVELNSRNN